MNTTKDKKIEDVVKEHGHKLPKDLLAELIDICEKRAAIRERIQSVIKAHNKTA